MKFSEAIREGAQHTKPQIGRFCYLRADGIYCCALGAAAYAVLGGEMPPDDKYRIRQILKNERIDTDIIVQHPLISTIQMELRFVVIDLNDAYEWSREQIADWLESVGY